MWESLVPVSYAVSTITFVIGTLSIVLRLYSRAFVVKQMWWDDWFMFSVFFFNAGQQAMLYEFLKYGGGLHMSVVPTADLFELEKLLFVEEIYYIFMQWINKMTILLFYLRLSTFGTFRNLVYGTMALNTVFTIAIWLLYCLQCEPLAAAYDPTITDAKCLSSLILYFIPAPLNIITDFIILFLPVKLIWNLQVTFRRKMAVLGILCFGSISVLVSVIRLDVLWQFHSNPDFTYILGKMIVISALEVEVAITAANIPSFKALWYKHVKGVSLGYTPPGAGSQPLGDSAAAGGGNGRSNHGRSGNGRSKGTQDVELGGLQTRGNDSEEQLFGKNEAIKVTQDVVVACEEGTAGDAPLHGKYYDVGTTNRSRK